MKREGRKVLVGGIEEERGRGLQADLAAAPAMASSLESNSDISFSGRGEPEQGESAEADGMEPNQEDFSCRAPTGAAGGPDRRMSGRDAGKGCRGGGRRTS